MTDQDPWLAQFEARRKEREQADRSVSLLGETLVVKAHVAPEVGLRLAAFQSKVNNWGRDVEQANKEGKPTPLLGVEDDEFLELSESVIVDCLEPESLKAWERMRAPGRPDPLSLMEIYGLAGFLLSKATRLPTVAPSDSSAGRQNGRTSSKVGSSSRAAARKR